MAQDNLGEGSQARGRRNGGGKDRVQLRLRVSCSAPSPEAEEAWLQFLVRAMRKGTGGNEQEPRGA